jgi:hypothetical protein
MDAAEIAVVEAAAGGLDNIGPAEVHVEILDDALIAGRKLDLGYILELTWRVVMKLPVFSLVRHAQDVVQSATLRIKRVQKFAEAEVTLAADDKVPIVGPRRALWCRRIAWRGIRRGRFLSGG